MRNFKKFLGVFVLVTLIIPSTVLAASIDDIKSSGKLTIKSVPPTKEEDAYMINESLSDMYGYTLDISTCNDDYTECNMRNMDGDSFKVSITYKYDNAVKTVVDNILKNIPKDGKVFHLNDVETLMFIRDYAYYEPDPDNPEDELNPLKYSSEYNKFVGYKNFVFEPRLGFDDLYSLYRGGTAQFTYDDTIYGFVDRIGVRVNNIVYVDDNEENIEDALKTRLSKYFKIKSIIKDEEITLDDMINDTLDYHRDEYNTCLTLKEELDAVPFNERDEEYGKNYSEYMERCSTYESIENIDEYLDSLLNDELLNKDERYGIYSFYDEVIKNPYVIEFEDLDNIMIPVFVAKDSSKIFDKDIEVKTKDALLNVEISTNSLIPLDTLIQAAKITSGEEYDKIVKILNNTNNEVYDLKLFSKSAADYITKLDDGYFEVKIPISDKLKGKNLSAYYIKEDDSVEEIAVTVSNGYAIFKTNHFSVYTLAEKPGSSSDTTPNNPQTEDTIMTNVIMLIISALGVTSLSLVYKKNKKIAKNN